MRASWSMFRREGDAAAAGPPACLARRVGAQAQKQVHVAWWWWWWGGGVDDKFL